MPPCACPGGRHMSRRPPIERRDKNEAEIVDALRAVGATVDQLPGDGRPDLLVGRNGRTYLLEVKMPDANTRMRKDEVAAGGEFEGLATTLTRKQATWWKRWNGQPAVIVTSPHDALVAIGAPCSCSTCAALAEADEVLAGPVRQDAALLRDL